MSETTEARDATTPAPLAPDGGWSWVVLACGFFNAVVIVGTPISFGIVFSEKLTMMKVSSTTMAWIYNLFNFNFFITSVFCVSLSDVFGWRSVSFFTISITGVGYACMVFATSPGYIFLLYSVIVGCSVGLASFITFLTIPHYFHIHRGRAGAIMATGISFGQVITPLLMRWLLDEYGFSGACLLYSGLVFNCAVTSLSFYPVRNRPLLKGDKVYEAAKTKRVAHLSSENKTNNASQIGEMKTKRSVSNQTPRGKIEEILKMTWHQMTQLQHFSLLIMTLSYTLFVVGFSNFSALLPFAMAALGHPAAETSYCFSIGALASTAVRIFVSWASDAKWFSRKIWFIFGAALSGASTFATVFVLYDTQLIMACQIFWGIGLGATISVFHNLLIDTCGRELYGAGIATTSMQMAVCNIVLGPLIGVARDYTSYEVSIGMTAILQLMCALVWIFMPLARRHDEKIFPDPRFENGEAVKASNLYIDVGLFKNKRTDAGEINAGFRVDSDSSITKRHSV